MEWFNEMSDSAKIEVVVVVLACLLFIVSMITDLIRDIYKSDEGDRE